LLHPQSIQDVSSFDRTTPQRLKLKNEEIMWSAKYFLKMLSAEIKINIFEQKCCHLIAIATYPPKSPLKRGTFLIFLPFRKGG